jgi:multiple sugar transport system permease protein
MFLPALLMIIGVMVPFCYGVYTSFTNTKLYIPNVHFVWFQNYIDLFSDRVFVNAMLITVGYALLVISIQIPLGLLVAQLLDVATPFRDFFRSALVLPMLIPPIVAGLMWKTMMHPASGVLNWLLGSLGISPFPWLSDVKTALFSIAVVDTWIFIPFVALILLAGLQSVPVEISEAARVDGASNWQVFRYIQIPSIVPYIFLVLMFRVADALKAFELIYPTTRGGPINATRVMNVMAYEEVFRWSSMGRAMAIIFVLWLISYTVSTYLVRSWQRSSIEVKGV